MIRVTPRPEPHDFESQVRKPGLKFLKSYPNPTEKQWKTHSYWRRVLRDLHSEYSGICSYSCHWIPFDTGADTVEHFKPKSKHPADAYDWKNYRLVCQLLNSRKRTEEDILDPFEIQTGWFIIEFPTLMVRPAQGLSRDLREQVITTRDLLGLNDESTCMAMRQEFVKDFCEGAINFPHIENKAPFLASQMRRQGFNAMAAIQKVMGIYPPID